MCPPSFRSLNNLDTIGHDVIEFFDIDREWWNGKKLAHTPHSGGIPLTSIGYSFNFRSTSAHICSIGFESSDWGGHLSTSKFCIHNHCVNNFARCLELLSSWNMTREGLKQYHSIVFRTPSWRMPRYKVCVISPLYLAHVTHATESHTTPHKICTTFKFNYMAHTMSL